MPTPRNKTTTVMIRIEPSVRAALGKMRIGRETSTDVIVRLLEVGRMEVFEHARIDKRQNRIETSTYSYPKLRQSWQEDLSCREILAREGVRPIRA
jgi:predicted CopG family antitoxin